MSYIEQTHDEEYMDYRNAPLPDTAEAAATERMNLISVATLLRDQIDAVNNGDAAPPSDVWIFKATTKRNLVQHRINRLNTHVASLKKFGQTADDKLRAENDDLKAAVRALTLMIKQDGVTA